MDFHAHDSCIYRTWETTQSGNPVDMVLEYYLVKLTQAFVSPVVLLEAGSGGQVLGHRHGLIHLL